MDKISGIIPSSARLTSVDMRDSSPVRPGTPSFGRSEGGSALKDSAKGAGLATAQKAVNQQSEIQDWRSKDSQQAALASELSDKFFARNQKMAEPMKDTEPKANMPALRASEFDRASAPSGFKTDEGGSLRASMRPLSGSAAMESFAESEAAEPAITLSQPAGLYPKGSFIDRSA